MNSILSIGLILLLGLISGKLIRKIRLPVVTAYIILGVAIGPYAFNAVSENILNASGLISNVALGFIAFSIGQNFSLENFKQIGKPVLWISVFEACGAWILVTFIFLVPLRQPLPTAILFGAISSATAPAATMMVIREYKAKGSFTDTLLGVVAVDDAWCLIIFAFSLAVAKAVSRHIHADYYMFKVIWSSMIHIVGAFILGGIISWLLSRFSAYARTQTEFLIYTLALILVNTGLAIYFHMSVLLANMFLGASLINISKANFKFFDVLRTVDSPLYLIFFVLAGANLQIPLLAKLSLLGAAYLIFRIVGKVGGAFIGGTIGKVSSRISKNIGWALVPQAGVALGVALIAKESLPATGNYIFSVIVATTIVYELIGPVCTKYALDRAGEI